MQLFRIGRGLVKEMITLTQKEKKSFVLYFAWYPCISALPAEQRGELLCALFEYAAEAAEGRMDLQPILDQHPDMAPEAQMVFRLLGETVCRDTEKWQEKHQRYQEAAQRRWEDKKTSSSDRAPKSPRDLDKDPWKASDDIWKYIN